MFMSDHYLYSQLSEIFIFKNKNVMIEMDGIALLRQSLTLPIVSGALDRHSVKTIANVYTFAIIRR